MNLLHARCQLEKAFRAFCIIALSEHMTLRVGFRSLGHPGQLSHPQVTQNGTIGEHMGQWGVSLQRYQMV